MDARLIEDLYALSPTQQGMLFQILAHPGSGMYLEQMVCALRGELEPEPFRRAWQQAVDRHSSLRTAFLWEGLSRPVQAVHLRAELAFEELDWRGLPPAEQRAREEAFLREDRRRGFDLARPPLTRVTLLRLDDDLRHLVWTTYHLVLDAWCVSILMREVLAVYEGLRQGRPVRLPPSPRYRDYIGWLKRQDLEPAEAYWRRRLAGFTAPTPLAGAEPPAGDAAEAGALERRQLPVDAATGAALAALARDRQITFHALLLGAWALVLAHTSGERDVVFGVVVSGRPPDLPGVAGMVGLFINTLPMRVQVAPDAPFGDWVRELQAPQAELHRFEATPLGQAQGWSEVPRSLPLFESILVLFNAVDFSSTTGASLRISYLRDVALSSYPLVVRVYPEPELVLEMLYDPRRFRLETVDDRLGQLRLVLAGIAADPDAPVERLEARLREEERMRQQQGAQERRAAAGLKLRNVVPRAVRLPAGEVEG